MNETTRIHPRKLKKVLCCTLGLMGVMSGGNAKCYDARPDPMAEVGEICHAIVARRIKNGRLM
ncbi:MAG: hypothetical protein WAO71_14390 [Gallionella sp.]